MSDRGVIFSAPMVRALLAGTKTQTRRLIKLDTAKLSPPFHPERRGARQWVFMQRDDAPGYSFAGGDFTVPYAPGDRLYVREAWAEVGSMDPGLIVTRADYPACVPPQYENVPLESEIKWKPSIHHPRRASRLWLSVTDVRVQRLQDISREDAIAEGLIHVAGVIEPDWWRLPEPLHQGTWLSPVAAYRWLWDSLHTKPGERWEDNPWIVAVSFDVHHGNIDASAPDPEIIPEIGEG